MINRCKHNPCCGDQTYCSRPIGLSAELAQARAEGERAGLERAAKVADLYAKITMQQREEAKQSNNMISASIANGHTLQCQCIATAIRALKVEGE